MEMKKDYRISVITPAYNAEAFIETMITSVMNQPVPVELIVVNDGSKDNTDAICTRLKEKYDNLKYIKVENGGAGKARNIGIRNASGKYVMFLDADDLFLEKSINEKLLEKTTEWERKGIDIVYTTIYKTDMFLESTPRVGYPEPIEKIRFHMPFFQFWACIYRREFLLEQDVFFYEYQKQDIETAFRFKAFSRTENKISDPQVAFYLQRDNLNSNTYTFNYYNLYPIKIKVFSQLKQEHDLRKKQIIENDDDLYLTREIVRQTSKYFSYLKSNGWNQASVETDIYEVAQLYKKCKWIPFWRFKRTDTKDILKYYVWDINCRRTVHHINSFVEMTKAISYHPTEKKEEALHFPSNEVILERLSKYSEKIGSVSA